MTLADHNALFYQSIVSISSKVDELTGEGAGTMLGALGLTTYTPTASSSGDAERLREAATTLYGKLPAGKEELQELRQQLRVLVGESRRILPDGDPLEDVSPWGRNRQEELPPGSRDEPMLRNRKRSPEDGSEEEEEEEEEASDGEAELHRSDGEFAVAPKEWGSEVVNESAYVGSEDGSGEAASSVAWWSPWASPRDGGEEEELQQQVMQYYSTTYKLDGQPASDVVSCQVVGEWGSCQDPHFPGLAIERRRAGSNDEYRFPDVDKDAIYVYQRWPVDGVYVSCQKADEWFDPSTQRIFRQVYVFFDPSVGQQYFFDIPSGNDEWYIYDEEHRSFVRHDLASDFKEGDLLYGTQRERNKVLAVIDNKIGDKTLITADRVNRYYFQDNATDALAETMFAGYEEFVKKYPLYRYSSKPYYDKDSAREKEHSRRSQAGGKAELDEVQKRRSCKALIAFVARGTGDTRIHFLVEGINSENGYTRSEVNHIQKYFGLCDRILFYHSDGTRTTAPEWWLKNLDHSPAAGDGASPDSRLD